MHSRAAKIIYIVVLLLMGGGVLYLRKYGPESFSHNDARKRYQQYQKAEATIVSQESNGRIGKGQAMIWTIQFKDDKQVLQTTTMRQNSFLGKEIGEKITVYYDPAAPTANLASEKEYNELMK